eukprot:gnl/Chilomastix_cuspidata/4231.p2 GENE.gnl/Chilomastix_cuspidata/4231~~gnl/Chilomastix_cuspidata/4231.p2  ORF type:complete len:330 (+),score=137.78 gnl/Chilomastix_cuspidata/4231:1525-2514(+)
MQDNFFTAPLSFEFTASWMAYCACWSERLESSHTLAISSFKEDYSNCFQVIGMNSSTSELEVRAEKSHPYPISKLQFMPNPCPNDLDLIVSSGDFLRIYEFDEVNKAIHTRAMLDNYPREEACAPVTSLDWAFNNKAMLGSCSTDSTATVWDVEKLAPVVHLKAHDAAVFDISFAPSNAAFSTCSQDGTIRGFDTRDAATSLLLYAAPTAVLKLRHNRLNENLVAAILLDDGQIIVVDRRNPGNIYASLARHEKPVNALCWAPHGEGFLATAGEDEQVLIWQIGEKPGMNFDPLLHWTADLPVNSVEWNRREPEWIAVTSGTQVTMLRI